MALTPVFLDFETYWDTKHSLTKMNPIAYVMHPETEIISVAVTIGKDRPIRSAFSEAAVRRGLGAIDWSDKIAIAHNMSGFDAMLLAWRCGIYPKMWGCTLAMARPHHAKTIGLSLAALAKHYDIGVKDSTALMVTKGKHLKDFTPEELAAMKVYNGDDTDLCRKLFYKLAEKTTPAEMVQIDHTIRMLVDPGFVVDIEGLEQGLVEEKARKKEVLLDLADMLLTPEEIAYQRLTDGADVEEVIRKTMASAPQFAELLESRGVPCPMKPSPSDPDKEIPALAKTDQDFLDLQDHDDPIVAMAARVRLDVKSTILESRIGSFLEASKAAGGYLPIPLIYYGAHTGRWSGWGYNPQNLPRIPRDKEKKIIPKPSNVLRMCMQAPPGYKVVVSDLSGIELRINHFLWKVQRSMHLFDADPEKADLYKDFAAALYGVILEEVSKEQRQIGKVAHLGLGFGAGAKTFVRIAKIMGGVDITLEEAQLIVDRWRSENQQIPQGWRLCERALEYVQMGKKIDIDPWGLVTTTGEGFRLPSGRIIHYPRLRRGVDKKGRSAWKFGDGRNLGFLTGGKCDENIVQAIGRDIIAEDSAEITRRTGIYPSLLAHDEIVHIVKEEKAERHLEIMNEVMRTPPRWWPELRVWSEGSFGDSYGESK